MEIMTDNMEIMTDQYHMKEKRFSFALLQYGDDCRKEDNMLFVKKLFWSFSCLTTDGILFGGAAIIFFGCAFYVEIATGNSIWFAIIKGWQYSSLIWFIMALCGFDRAKLKWVWSRKKRKKIRRMRRA